IEVGFRLPGSPRTRSTGRTITSRPSSLVAWYRAFLCARRGGGRMPGRGECAARRGGGGGRRGGGGGGGGGRVCPGGRARAGVTAAATRHAPDRLCRNAVLAAAARVWAGPGSPAWASWWAAAAAPPTDPRAAVRARAGSSEGSSSPSRLMYKEAATLPITA